MILQQRISHKGGSWPRLMIVMAGILLCCISTASASVSAITAGGENSGILKSDGTVLFWGSTSDGQTTVPAAASSGVAAISSGYTFTVALKTDGSVVAWGRSFEGQTTVPAPASSGVSAISAGNFFALALKSGSVIAWGSNSQGQTTVPVGATSGVTAIAAGGYHALALKSDGSVVSWGMNTQGQSTVPVGASSGVTAVATGYYHSLALKSDGSVVAWGDNTYGQATVPAGASSGVIAIAGGGYHSVALKSDGSVVAWGINTIGQTTVPSTASSGVTAIDAGGAHTLALKSDGSVIGWGYNSFGQITIPDLMPPTVTSTGPVNSATGFAPNAIITATFNEAMDAATISGANLTLTGPGGAVTGATAYLSDTKTAAFTPSANLAANTTYTATLTTGVKDSAGNAMASSYTWSFTTGSAPLIGGTIQGAPLAFKNYNAGVATFAGAVGTWDSVDAIGTAARFKYPWGITTDGTNLFVADQYNCTIRKIVISTAAVTTIAGSPGVCNAHTDGTGSAARFYTPYGITTDGTNLFVTQGNHTIRKVVIATGEVTTLAGSAGLSGSTNGTGSAARFYYPDGITTDGRNLFVADYANHTIRQIVIATGAVTTLAGSPGAYGYADGTGSAARFWYPYNMTTDGTNLFVGDGSGRTIRKIVISTGVVTTLAGLAGNTGSTDGTGSAARFNTPHGITTDGTNLYVVDKNNYTIRQVVISTGAVTTLAGAAGQLGSTDGISSAARFNYPVGIITDGTYLYVADTVNETIRRLAVTPDTTAPTTTTSPSGGSFTAYQSVTLSCSDDMSGCGNIYYTTNGATPNVDSPVYSGPITVSATTTLKFYAVDLEGNSETIKTETYTMVPVLDSTMGSGGAATYNGATNNNDYGNSVAVQSNGKMVVAGYTHNGTNWDSLVARYNADGTLDSTFGTGGIVIYDGVAGGNDYGNSAAVQSDGKIVVAGSSDSATNKDVLLLRYDTNGSLDSSFGTGGVVTYNGASNGADAGNSLFIQPDGKIVVAGYSYTGTYDILLLRYNTDGTLDTTFGTGGIVTYAGPNWSDNAYAVTVQSDGKIVVAGETDNGMEAYDAIVLRYNSDGTPDNSFGTGGIVTYGSANARGVAVQSDGKIVAVGTKNSDVLTLRYTSTGTLDSAFGTGGVVLYNGAANDVDNGKSVTIQSDNKIIVVGNSGSGVNDDVLILRYNTGGTLDTTFGVAGVSIYKGVSTSNDYGNSVALNSAGNIIVTGSTYTDGTGDDLLLLRLIDTMPPTVTTTTPLNGASSVALNTAVNVTFSEEMNASTIDIGTFTLWDVTNDTSVSGTVSYDGPSKTATFTPLAPLSYVTNYEAMVTNGVKDLAGNVTAANYSWSFATEAAPTVSYTLSLTIAGAGTGAVSSVPSGLNCETSCSGSFNSGTSVTLTANANSGASFTGWSGACTGTGTCTVIMDGAKSVTATFAAIDSVPPSLNISTLSNGSATNNPTLNVSGTVTDNVGVQSLSINGASVTFNVDGAFSHALTLLNGSNAITTIATDMNGNQTSDTRTIYLDVTAPTLVITAPADNVKTANSSMTITGTVDENATVEITLNSGTPQTASVTGTSFTATVNLASGINTIDVIATDLAGNNSSTGKRTVTYDLGPSVAITSPSQDITTSQGSIVIAGTASDLYTTVAVTVTVDGNTYTPTVTDGLFEQSITFGTQKTYQVSVTVTNELGSVATAQRNIIYNIPPAVPVNSKQDGEKVASTAIPDLVVTNVANPDSKTITYDFEVYDDSKLTNKIASISDVTAGSGTTSWQVGSTTFIPGTIYYWRSRANDGTSHGDWSKTYTFVITTGGEIAGDINYSGAVDGYDLVLMSVVFGKKSTDSGFNPYADLNDDGVIDGKDLLDMAPNLGKHK